VPYLPSAKQRGTLDRNTDCFSLMRQFEAAHARFLRRNLMRYVAFCRSSGLFTKPIAVWLAAQLAALACQPSDDCRPKGQGAASPSIVRNRGFHGTALKPSEFNDAPVAENVRIAWRVDGYCFRLPASPALPAGFMVTMPFMVGPRHYGWPNGHSGCGGGEGPAISFPRE
jgi:hypothetical protein